VDGSMGPFTFALSGASSCCPGCTARIFVTMELSDDRRNPSLDASTCYR
jgi:hypothetical protein